MPRIQAKQSSAPGSQPRPRGKPRGIRRDRDCVTCKTRGLKCDLNRPQCLPCRQAGLLCGGYPVRVVWLEERRRRRQSSSPSSVSSPADSPPFLNAPTAVPTVQTAFAQEASGSTFSSSSPDSMPLLSPLAASLSPSPSSPPWDEEPWCETDQNSLIKRLAALCNHILTKEDAHHTTPANQYLALPETTGLLSDLCIFIQARLEGRKLPIAAVQQQQQQDQRADSLDMVRHRLTALARVNRAIEAANPFAFLGIATFAVFEVCDTAFGEWQCHLYGARHLLDYHRCRTPADLRRLAAFVPGLLDILSRLVWFDVSGAVVHHGPGAAAGNSSGSSGTPLIFDDWHRAALLDADFFATVGLPADACALYVDVAKARLARRPVQACLRAAEQVLRVKEAAGAAEDLSDWDLSANVNRCAAALAALGQVQEAQEAQRAQRATDADADADADAHADSDAEEDRAACEATMAVAVEKLCAALAAMPVSSRFYIHMAVGAYVAGMRARTREQCAIVRQYWLNCSICGISRYPGGLARCEERWRRVGLLDE